MTATATNVRVGVTGAVYHAATGTALPTTAVVALNVAFADVGYISDDGITQEIGTDSKEIVAWGGDTVRKVQTSHDLTYKFTMIEANPESKLVYYGNYTAGTGASTVQIKSTQLPRQCWVLSVVDSPAVIRVVIPDGQVTDRGEVTYKTDEAVGYEVTITCYPDTSGVKAYEYTDADGV
jgi:hypothetical protein